MTSDSRALPLPLQEYHNEEQNPRAREFSISSASQSSISSHTLSQCSTMVLDIQDFIVGRGGDPQKIKESQRRRHAPESIVDDIIETFEDHRKSILYIPACLGSIS